jgi:competence protein ComEC
MAYGAGLWIGLVVLTPDGVLWVLMLLAAILVRWRVWAGALSVALAVGTIVGMSHAERQERSCAVRWQAGPKSIVVQLHDSPSRQGVTTGTVLHAAAGCDGQLRLKLPEGNGTAGSVALAAGPYYASGVLRVTRLRELAHSQAWRFRIRATIARRIQQLYGDRAALVEAMVLGRRGDVSRSLRSQFADAGLAHLLAISGLHVGILAGWLVLVLRWIGIGRRRWLVAALLTWGYVLLLGFPTPATRAAAFVTIYSVARHRQRHPPAMGVLAVAVTVVMHVNPGAATAVGAWLSVAAVWGTGWGGRLLPISVRRSALAKLAASSVGAVLATAPITAYSFGAVAPIGLLSNLIAIPLAAVAVPGVMASLAFGEVVAGGAGLALMLIERVAALSASVPGGHIVGVAGAGFALPWVLILVVVVWGARHRRDMTRLRRKLLVGAAVSSWGLVIAAVWQPSGQSNALSLYVLDVGQGDAIAIRTPRGKWLLVDGGPRTRTWDAGRNVVLPFLRRRGVGHLSAVVVTHGDADHVGGIPSVLQSLGADFVLEPGQPLSSSLYGEYLSTVDADGVNWRAARAGDTVTVDSVVLAVLHPDTGWVGRQFEPNENSVVIHLRYGCFDALLTGDIGHVVERALLQSVQKVDVLKVGHHGSAGSTSAEWLQALSPLAAVISVGRNRFGHPAPVVLELLQEHRVPTWRTDEGGMVTINTDGRYLRIEQESEGRLRCLIRRLLRSSASSSSRSGCTLKPPVISPICSTPSP